jgi:peptidoglycan/LPS O-acetylase OafA/YrhL
LAIVAAHCFLQVPLGGLNYSDRINTNITFFNAIVRDITVFDVPLFIIISGFVLSRNYLDKFNVIEFLKRRLLSIVPPYIIFSIIAIIGIGLLNVFPTISQIMFMLITASASDPLWFIAVMIQFYLLYPLIIKVYQRFETMRQIHRLIIFCLILVPSWSIFLTCSNALFNENPYTIMLSRIFIPYLVYFIVGIYINRNYDKVKLFVKKQPLSLLTGLILVLITLEILSFKYPNYPGREIIIVITKMILTFVIVALLLRLVLCITYKFDTYFSLLKSFGKYSFGIYLVHPCVEYVLFITILAIGISLNNWIIYPLVFISTSIISYVSTLLISYLPYSKYIIGRHNTIGMLKQLIPKNRNSSVSNSLH